MCESARESSTRPRKGPDMTVDLSRRQFLSASAALGGGLLIGFRTGAAHTAEGAAGATFTPNAFIRIGADGQIVLTMPYVEMGQGTYTSIPMLIAEELEVDLKPVRLQGPCSCRRRRSAGMSIRRPATREAAKCVTRRPGDASNMASSPPTPP